MEVKMPVTIAKEIKFILPPWPYKTWEARKNAKVEGEKVRSNKPFYPGFMEDVFAEFV